LRYCLASSGCAVRDLAACCAQMPSTRKCHQDVIAGLDV
jgi:hypothetical protein